MDYPYVTVQATIKVTTWFDDEAGNWVGDVDHRHLVHEGGIRRITGDTEEKARNAALAIAASLFIESICKKEGE